MEYFSGSSGGKGTENYSFDTLRVSDREKKKEGDGGEVGDMKWGIKGQLPGNIHSPHIWVACYCYKGLSFAPH